MARFSVSVLHKKWRTEHHYQKDHHKFCAEMIYLHFHKFVGNEKLNNCTLAFKKVRSECTDTYHLAGFQACNNYSFNIKYSSLHLCGISNET